jgi:hypothetical protein
MHLIYIGTAEDLVEGDALGDTKREGMTRSQQVGKSKAQSHRAADGDLILTVWDVDKCAGV